MNPVLKWLGIAVAVLVVLIAGITVLLYLVVDEERLKATLVEVTERELDATLEIAGDLRFSVFPSIAVQVDDVSLRTPAGATDAFAAARRLKLGARLLPLLKGELSIGEVALEGLRVQAHRNARGRGNWERLLRSDEKGPGAAARAGSEATPAAAAPGGAPAAAVESDLLLQIDRVRVEDGSLDFVDEKAGSHYRIEALSFVSDDVNTDGDPFDVKGSARVLIDDGAQDLRLALGSRVTISRGGRELLLEQAQLELQPAEGPALEMRAPRAALVLDKSTLEVPELGLSADGLDASGSVSADWSLPPEVAASGKLDLRKLDLPALARTLALELPATVNPEVLGKLALSAGYRYGDGAVALENVELHAGDINASGSLRYGLGKIPRIEAKLSSPQLDLDYLMPPPATPPAEEASDEPAMGKRDIAKALAMSGSIEADLGRFLTSGLEMENVRLLLQLRRGMATLKRLDGRLYGGKLVASGAVDGRKAGALQLEAEFKGVDVKSLLAATQQIENVEGKVNGSLDLQATGTTPRAWSASLKGPVRLRVDDPVLRDMSVEEVVCKAAATLNKEALSAPFEPLTRFESIETALAFDEGVGTIRTLTAAVPNMTLRGEGSISLPKRRLDLQLNARVTDDLAKLDPACRMSKKMLRIEWPISCKGGFDESPKKWCGIDGDDLAKIATQLATEKLQDKLQDKLGDFFKKRN